MNSLHLLWRYLQASVKSQLQYPASAVMLNISQFILNIIDVLAIGALFARFGRVQGWRFGEVVFFYAVVSISFAIADFLTRGFDVFGTDFVKTGAFDRVLLRPRSATLQLIGYDFRLSRFGRLAQGLVALGLASVVLRFHWGPEQAALGSGRSLAAWRCSAACSCCRARSPSGRWRAWKWPMCSPTAASRPLSSP
jgi:ABC-2 type transport system permease protein